MRERQENGGIRHYGPFELHDGENLLSLRDIRYSPADAQITSCNTVFQVKAVSGEFAGVGEFECGWADFLRFVSEVNELYHFKRYEVEFRDSEWGNWFKFSISKLGSMTISGYLYGEGMQTLDFWFRTDQTVILPFLQQIMKQLS